MDYLERDELAYYQSEALGSSHGPTMALKCISDMKYKRTLKISFGRLKAASNNPFITLLYYFLVKEVPVKSLLGSDVDFGFFNLEFTQS